MQQTYLNSTYSPILFFTTNSSDTTTNSTVANNSINKNDDKFYLIVYSGVAVLIPIVFSLKGLSLAKVSDHFNFFYLLPEFRIFLNTVISLNTHTHQITIM